MEKILEEFLDIVSRESPFQKRYLEKWDLKESEKEELETFLKFFVEYYGYTINELADNYLFINNMIMEETLYFKRNGTYRHSTLKSVEEQVYKNEEYMTKYMCGLSISDYIWAPHIKMLRYFEDSIKEMHGERYLEIGPGFGQYLLRAISGGQFQELLAVDLSETSVKKCRDYMAYRHVPMDVCKIQNMDFFDFSSEEMFDCIVMGEVLEHVEAPLKMLEKIYDLLIGGGYSIYHNGDQCAGY